MFMVQAAVETNLDLIRNLDSISAFDVGKYLKNVK